MECSVFIPLYLIGFFEVANEEPRVGTSQISLYMAILTMWVKSGCSVPFKTKRIDLMKVAKIQSRQTFNKTIRDLHEVGFIRYYPSKNGNDGSVIYIRSL